MNAPRDNFHQAELDKFGALANRWWDADGPQKALHALNPVRLDYVRERTRLDDARILDVGCGGGLLSEAMAQRNAASPRSIWPRTWSRSRSCTAWRAG